MLRRLFPCLVAFSAALSLAFAGGSGGAEAPSVEVEVGPNGVRIFADNADAHEVFVKLAQATGLRIMVDDT
ncbi:MAG: hypothetical protein WHU10_01520, partial [Fimbriimonadales bacterium]